MEWRTCAIWVAERNVPFEDVVVEPRLLAREIWLRQAKCAGQSLNKQLVVGHLGAARRRGIRNELREFCVIDFPHASIG